MKIGMQDGRLTFGKYAGHVLPAVPIGYLGWLLDEDIAVQYGMEEAVCDELRRRLRVLPETPPAPAVRVPITAKSTEAHRIIQAGRRALAAKHHPDRGGELTTMQDINTTADWLETLIDTLLTAR